MATFAKKWKACVGKDVYPTVFKVGDECPAEVEALAAEHGVLEGQEPAAKPAAAAKAR